MNILWNGGPKCHINGIKRWIEMVSALDLGISVFVGLFSIALSYHCIKDKWLYTTQNIILSLTANATIPIKVIGDMIMAILITGFSL